MDKLAIATDPAVMEGCASMEAAVVVSIMCGEGEMPSLLTRDSCSETGRHQLASLWRQATGLSLTA